MPTTVDLGDPVPADGSFPQRVISKLQSRAETPLGLYVHIPFCTVRCGYCDFNTYTAQDLGAGASRATYPDTLIAELEFAARVLEQSGAPRREFSTVFFGGGTPTLLPATDLARILARARELFGFLPGAEITTEANPDTLTDDVAATLAQAGFTRISIGMQSAVSSVLETLDRTHDPANVARAVQAARKAGLEVSLDLIYGTPGETFDQWETTLSAAVALKPDHISAYSLIIEEGTALAGKIRRGVYKNIDPDDQAEKYTRTDQVLSAAGYDWYEVSNFATSPRTRSQHNLNYWLDTDWWGAGPGAHSHMAGLRWSNVKHPAAYAQRLRAGVSPGHSRELLTDADKALEYAMLRVRIREGLDVGDYQSMPGVTPILASELEAMQQEGLITRVSPLVPAGAVAGVLAQGDAADQLCCERIVLTLKGRLLADAVTRRLVA